MAKLRYAVGVLVPLLFAPPAEAASPYAEHPVAVPPPPADMLAADRRKRTIAEWTKEAGSGNREAAFQLGHAYRTGECVTRDPNQARTWLQRAAKAGNPQAQVELADMIELGEGSQTDGPAAIRWLQAAAKQHNIEAQKRLGQAYLHGDLIAPDPRQALTWYLQAAQTGDAEACYEVGLSYENGRGTRANYSAAARWFRKALDRNKETLDHDRQHSMLIERPEALAALELGRMNELGQGTQSNATAARYWYGLAAHGAIEAKIKLASYQLPPPQKDYNNITFDLDQLRELLQTRLHGGTYYPPNAHVLDLVFPEGHEPGMGAKATLAKLLKSPKDAHLLGILYLHGWGVPRDLAKAMAWFKRAEPEAKWASTLQMAALLPNGTAKIALLDRVADAYFPAEVAGPVPILRPDRKGILPDFATRLKTLQRLAARENADAMAELGVLTIVGFGVESDPEKATKLFAAAARHNHAGALYTLSQLAEVGIGLPMDQTAKFRLLQRAAAAGEPMAAYDLAIYHAPSSGWNAPKSEVESLRWWKRAAEIGMDNGFTEAARQYERARNLHELARWYQAGAESHQPWARAGLARLYAIGAGVPKDPKRALALIDAAGNQQPSALRARLMLTLDPGPATQAAAQQILRNAAANGDQDASFHLGVAAEQAGDYAAARQWYEKTVDQETAEGGPEAEATHEAVYRLGHLYDNGLGVPKDLKQAATYYGRSQSANAVRRLGEMYEQGLGVPKDPNKATEIYQTSLRQRLYWHTPDLDFLEQAPPSPCMAEDVATLAILLERAASEGDGDAASMLGRLFEFGRGLPNLPTEARHWYGLGSQLGSLEADYRLGRQLEETDPARAAAYYRKGAWEAKPLFDLEEDGEQRSAAYQEAMRWLFKLREDVTKPTSRYDFVVTRYVIRQNERITWDMLQRPALENADLPELIENMVTSGRSIEKPTPEQQAWLDRKRQEGWFPANLIQLALLQQDGQAAATRPLVAQVAASARSGDANAQAAYGWILGRGIGRAPDPIEALAWLRLAESQGKDLTEYPSDALAQKLDHKSQQTADQRTLDLWREIRRSLLGP